MKMIKKAVIGAAIAMAFSGVQASMINVGGVTWDPSNPVFGADKDFTGRYSFNQWFTNFANPTTLAGGEQLQGTGEFTSFNGISIDPNSVSGGAAGSFCPGCELTFSFGGLFVNGPASLDFTNGYLNIFVATGGDIDYNNSANPLNIPGASNGNMFLSLKVVDLDFTPIGNNGFANGALTLSLQAVGGIAKSNFDTNTLGFGFDLGSSASAQFQLTDINGDLDPKEWVGTSTGQVAGNSIPEPASLALVGLGLLGAGALRRRRVAAK